MVCPALKSVSMGLLCRSLSTSSTLLKVIPKNLKGQKNKGGQDWLTRHINDPYVKRAYKDLYRYDN